MAVGLEWPGILPQVHFSRHQDDPGWTSFFEEGFGATGTRTDRPRTLELPELQFALESLVEDGGHQGIELISASGLPVT